MDEIQACHDGEGTKVDLVVRSMRGKMWRQHRHCCTASYVSSPLRISGLVSLVSGPIISQLGSRRSPSPRDCKYQMPPDSGRLKVKYPYSISSFCSFVSFFYIPTTPRVAVLDLLLSASPANSNRLPPNSHSTQPLTARHLAQTPLVARSQEQTGSLRLQNERHHACDRLPGLLRPATACLI